MKNYKEILKDFIKVDSHGNEYLWRDKDPWMCYDLADKDENGELPVALEGEFSLEQLEAIVYWIKENNK